MTLALSEARLRSVQKRVEAASYSRTPLLNLAKSEGLIEPTEAYKSDASIWKFDAANPGHLGAQAFENAVELASGISELKGTLLIQSGKLQLSPAQLAQMENTATGVDVAISRVLENQAKGMLKAHNSFLACGQAGRYLSDDDSWKKNSASFATGDVRGLFHDSSIQTIGGGNGGDDNVSAYGDYHDTFATAETQFLDNGIDASKVYVFMDTGTLADMKKTRLATYGLSEVALVKGSFPDWIVIGDNSVLATDLTSNHYMMFVAPKEDSGEGTIAIKESLAPTTIPIGNGSIQPNGNFQWFLGMKHGVIVKNGYGVAKTGALTLA